MATLGGTITRATIGYLAARANQPKARREWNLAAGISAVFKCVMHLLGFAALTYAGYTINLTTAFIVGGISCFVFSWLVAPDKPESPSEVQIRR